MNKDIEHESFSDKNLYDQYNTVRRKIDKEYQNLQFGIMIQGHTRIGKSCFTQLLSGKQLKIIRSQVDGVYCFVQKTSSFSQQKSNIKSGPNSYTQFPNFLPLFNFSNATVIDNSGTKDHSHLQRFINSYYQKQTLSKIKNIYFILVTKLDEKDYLGDEEMIAFKQFMRMFPNSSNYLTICINLRKQIDNNQQQQKSRIKAILENRLKAQDEKNGNKIHGLYFYYRNCLENEKFCFLPSAKILAKRHISQYKLPQSFFKMFKQLQYQPNQKCRYIHTDITDGRKQAVNSKFVHSMKVMERFVIFLKNMIQDDLNIFLQLSKKIVKSTAYITDIDKMQAHKKQIISKIETKIKDEQNKYKIKYEQNLQQSPSHLKKKTSLVEKQDLPRVLIIFLYYLYSAQTTLRQKQQQQEENKIFKTKIQFQKHKIIEYMSSIVGYLREPLRRLLVTQISEQKIEHFLKLTLNSILINIQILLGALQMLECQQQGINEINNLKSLINFNQTMDLITKIPFQPLQFNQIQAQLYFLHCKRITASNTNSIETKQQVSAINFDLRIVEEIIPYIFHTNKNSEYITRVDDSLVELAFKKQFIGEVEKTQQTITYANVKQYEQLFTTCTFDQIKHIQGLKLAKYYESIEFWVQSLKYYSFLKYFHTMEQILTNKIQINIQNFKLFIQYGDYFKENNRQALAFKMYDIAHECNTFFNPVNQQLVQQKTSITPKSNN